MNLYLVRHGITRANLDHVFQLDQEPLAELGLEQAKEMVSFFRGIKISRILSSPMKRAVETAHLLGEEYRITPEIDNRIKEIESASHIKGKSVYLEELQDLIKTIDTGFFSRSNKKIADEESYDDVSRRVDDFLNYLKDNCLGENIVAVTHHRFIAFFLSKITGYDSAENLHCYFEHLFNIKNTAIVHITYNESLVNRYTSTKSPWTLLSIH